MVLEAFNFQGGQYKKMSEKKMETFCQFLYKDAYKIDVVNFFDSLTVKIPYGTCPVPAGEYDVSNFLMTNNGLLPPYIPGGEKWKINARYIKGTEVVGGYNVYALVRNEQSLISGG